MENGPLSRAILFSRNDWALSISNRIDSMNDSPAAERPLDQRVFDEWPDAVRTLFDHFCDHAEEIPGSIPDAPLSQRVADHIAGMTDRFAVALFEDLAVPTTFTP